MRIHYYILILLISLPFCIASDWQYNTKDLTIDLTIQSEIYLIQLSDNSKISSIKANLTFVPKDSTYQKISNLNISPEATKFDDSIIYTWKNPSSDELPYSVKATVNLENYFIGVNKKVNFPLKDIQKELEIYIKPTKNIDSNNESIILLSSQIAQGQDDAYHVLFRLAEWVEGSIDYNLGTLTAEISQKSSWVLKNRYGVCDELTSLFIALARSLGFPAKFISGLAYTNWNNINDFGPHAWAEIYLPSFGWIPFDVTYGEFGWIDPTHIKLKESLDSDESSVYYEWIGNNIDLKLKKLGLKANITNINDGLKEPILITSKPFKEEVGFGSYNLIETEIKNLGDYYRPIELFISRADEIEVIGNEKRHVLLKPNDIKKVYWLIRVGEDLDQNYMYRFPIIVSSLRNTTSATQFKSSILNIIYSKDEMEDILNEYSEEEKKTYSRNLDFNCKTDKIIGHLNEKATIKCNIKNLGNAILKDISVCLEYKCQKLDLGINQEKILDFIEVFDGIGTKDLKIMATNEFVSKPSFISITTLDKPNIKIINITTPEQVHYGDYFEISIILNRISISVPKDVNLYLKQGFLTHNFKLNHLENNQNLVVEYKANTLRPGQNEFTVLIRFKDDEGNSYETNKKFIIELTNTNFLQKIHIFFNRAFAYFNYKLFKYLT